MMNWCDEQKEYSFAGLMRFSQTENEAWFRSLCDNAGWIMKEYMKSAGWLFVMGEEEAADLEEEQ